jgi:hypothetical protein
VFLGSGANLVARVYEQKDFLENNLDSENLRRFVLGKVPDLSGKWNALKNWFGSGSAYFEERNRCVVIGC